MTIFQGIITYAKATYTYVPNRIHLTPKTCLELMRICSQYDHYYGRLVIFKTNFSINKMPKMVTNINII